jgi:hypothetical protein
MDTTELLSPSAAPTFGEMLAETIPLVGAIAGYGPPVVFVAGPWLLLALLLSAPFAVLLTLIAAMLLAAAAVVAVTAAIGAVPYVLIRGLRRYRARRALGSGHVPQLIPVGTTRVAA